MVMRVPTMMLFLAMLASVLGCGGGGANRSAGPMPTGGTFTGVWFSPQYGEMHMVQTGNAVVGEYTKDERSGRIQGTAQGDLMRFEWNEERELVSGRPTITRGRGYFHYAIGDDGKHNILGEWGIDDNETGGGSWNAYKLARRQPQLSTDTSGGGSTDQDDWGDTGEEGGGGGLDDSGDSGGGDDSGGGGDSGDVDTDALDL